MNKRNYLAKVEAREKELARVDMGRFARYVEDGCAPNWAEQHAFTLQLAIDALTGVRDECRKPEGEYDAVEAAAHWNYAKVLMEGIELSMMDAAADMLRGIGEQN